MGKVDRKKNWKEICVEGLCWLLVWSALFFCGKGVIRLCSFLPRIHFSIDYEERESDGGTLSEFVDKNAPSDRRSEGASVFLSIASALKSGELVGELDARSELLTQLEAINDSWKDFGETVFSRIDKDKLISDLESIALTLDGGVSIKEVFRNAVLSSETVVDDEVGSSEGDFESDSMGAPIEPIEESDKGGEGGTSGTGEADQEPASPAQQPTQRNYGYGWRWW